MKARKYTLYTLLVALCAVAGSLEVAAQDLYKALPWNHSIAYNSYLMREVHQQYAERDAAFEQAVGSQAALKKYISDSKARYKAIVGEFPAKQPLNAQVTGVVQGEGFCIEKVVFESLPGRYVTAHLYMPDGQTTPVPAALEFCGHSFTGKIPVSQSALLMAANGIAVLVVDPIGQGERIQLIDEAGKPLTRGSTTEHTLLNAGMNLMGTSLAAQELWDNHRALDYLISRPDIDSERIGVYGSSGGGTQATYFIGLDERIKVAAICSFFSNRARTLEMQGPSDGCQHVPYEGREQLELADFALMVAPKPLLILSGKYDFVDLWGAQQGYKQLQKAYTTLGVADKLDMLTVEAGHGLREEKRDKLTAWFMQWFMNSRKPVRPAFQLTANRTELQCSDEGQVNIAFPNALSVMDESMAQFKAWEQERQRFQKRGYAAVRKQVLKLLGGNVISNAPLRPTLTRTIAGRGYTQYNYQLIREGEMPVPCVLIIPETATAKSPIELCLFEEGKSAFLGEFTNITAALADGTILLAADLRGLGELADPPFYNDAKYWNVEYRNAMTSMHIGRPILGQRVTDVMSLVDFCSVQKELKNRPIHVRASGVYGPVAIHAAFLDKRIKTTHLTRSIDSWQSYLSNPMQRDMYSNVLYGVLRYYDLPDLVRLTGKVEQALPSLEGFRDGIHHWNLTHKERNYARYEAGQYREIADNLIAYQNGDGGWPKNIDWLGVLNTDSVYEALKDSYKNSTLDNRNTFPQIEYLADVYGITKEARYKTAALKGLAYLLDTQKANGGWRGWDVDAITFNDDVTTGALELFRNIVQGDESFAWLDATTFGRIESGYERGLQMVLDCQVVQQGVKTAWAQQHDNETLLPVQARSYELPAISGNESCEVIRFLMGIENPSPEVIEAVKRAVAWLEKVQIRGIRVERITLPEEQIINHEYPYDNVVVEDPNAEPIWARYYEVADNTPFLCTRAGVKVWKLADVNAERRTGYDWYGYWPKSVLAAYPDWLKSVGR